MTQAFAALFVAFHRGLESWFREHRQVLVTSMLFAPFGQERDVHAIANELETVVALLSTGVSPLEYRRFLKLCPYVATVHDGMNHVHVAELEGVVREPDSFVWAERFVIRAVLHWQRAGLSPKIDDDDGAVAQFEEYVSVAEGSSGPTTGADGVPESGVRPT